MAARHAGRAARRARRPSSPSRRCPHAAVRRRGASAAAARRPPTSTSRRATSSGRWPLSGGAGDDAPGHGARRGAASARSRFEPRRAERPRLSRSGARRSRRRRVTTSSRPASCSTWGSSSAFDRGDRAGARPVRSRDRRPPNASATTSSPAKRQRGCTPSFTSTAAAASTARANERALELEAALAGSPRLWRRRSSSISSSGRARSSVLASTRPAPRLGASPVRTRTSRRRRLVPRAARVARRQLGGRGAGGRNEQWPLAQQFGRESTTITSWPSAVIAAHRGEIDRARELAERALARRRPTRGRGGGLRVGARVHRALARTTPAARWSTSTRADRIPRELGHPRARAAVVRARSARRAARRGRRSIAPRQMLAPWEEPRARRSTGLGAGDRGANPGAPRRGRGDLDGAFAGFEEALAAHERADDPFQHARTLLALGATQRRAKQRRAARETLEQALGALHRPAGAAVG